MPNCNTLIVHKDGRSLELHESEAKTSDKLYKWTISVFVNTFLLYPRSSFPDSKEQYPDFPLKNGGMAGAIELKRPVSAHCHGTKALACEDSVDKLMAKKKLYIASAVCLVFMIGEVIGKSLEVQTSWMKENRRSDICISFLQSWRW